MYAIKMEKEVIIDFATIKALASKTRLGIVKKLQEHRFTQSELSRIFDISIPTAKEHLDVLENVQLIRKMEEGRKWKYYALTEKGKNIADAEPKKIFVFAGLLSAFHRFVCIGTHTCKYLLAFRPQ